LGEGLEVLWERELDAIVLGATSWDAIANRGFDNPRLFSAYLVISCPPSVMRQWQDDWADFRLTDYDQIQMHRLMEEK